jgi:hypothetical protein
MTESTAAAPVAAPKKGFLASKAGRATLVVGALAALGAGAAVAQGMGHGPRGMGGGFGGMMGGRGFERLCAVDVNFVTQRMADGLATRLTLTDAQKPALNDLRAAAVAAATEAKKSCGQPQDTATAPGRMALAQQRLQMAGTALATIKPKLDAFYAQLNDEQKKTFDKMGPHGGRGHGGGEGRGRHGQMDGERGPGGDGPHGMRQRHGWADGQRGPQSN